MIRQEDLPPVKTHHPVIITFIIIIVLALVLAAWGYFSRFASPGSRDGGLTAEEKARILESLNQPVDQPPLTEEQKGRILQSLNAPVGQAELSAEEKARILESLNQPVNN